MASLNTKDCPELFGDKKDFKYDLDEVETTQNQYDTESSMNITPEALLEMFPFTTRTYLDELLAKRGVQETIGLLTKYQKKLEKEYEKEAAKRSAAGDQEFKMSDMDFPKLTAETGWELLDDDDDWEKVDNDNAKMSYADKVKGK